MVWSKDVPRRQLYDVLAKYKNIDKQSQHLLAFVERIFIYFECSYLSNIIIILTEHTKLQ